jgi:NAD(P)-dependent dehydrogenase (short-subunit alcohol dehydrogenase family)
VVTGASSGIGAATVDALAQAGATVIAVARRLDRLEATAAANPAVRAYGADVSSDASVERLAWWVGEEFGACHLLVNCAGIGVHEPFRGPADLAVVEETLDVNFFGTVRCMAAFAELLGRSAPSRVVNVASVAGKLGVGPPGYVASKFAVVGFTEAVALDWAERGIAVCQVNPGFVHTEGFPQEQLMASPLTRRLVTSPQVVAAAIVEVARSGTPERTVPHWYRALIVLRHVASPLFRAAANRLPRRTSPSSLGR